MVGEKLQFHIMQSKKISGGHNPPHVLIGEEHLRVYILYAVPLSFVRSCLQFLVALGGSLGNRHQYGRVLITQQT